MNILFLAHRIPFPPDKGDKIRSFNEIKYLSKNNNIFLGTTLDQESDKRCIAELKRYCRGIYAIYFNKKIKLIKNSFRKVPFSVSYFYDTSLQNYVNKILKEKEIDAVVCFCSSMAEYIFKTPLIKNKTMINGTKLIMDFIDVDSDKWLQYARYKRFPFNLLYKSENRRLLKYEVNINETFHHSVFVSQGEVEVFKKLYPEARNVYVIPNGVDHNYFSPKPTRNNSKSAIRNPQSAITNSQHILVFTGVMDYFANENGVRWFCKDIYHKIKADIPDTQFYIVGSRPTKSVLKLSKIDGVTITGYVEDVREYYWLADVCVVPLRIARGLQNKVLEAMATGNAVVSTSNAAKGIIYHENRDIIIADDDEVFAREVVSLLKDEDRRKELGKKAVENIRKNYSWEANLKKFDELLQS